MSSYSFSDDAVRDLDEVGEDMARSNPDAAMRGFDAIQEKCKLVAGFPNMGKIYARHSSGLRGFIVDDYLVFYYPRKDGITLREGRQRIPGFRD